MKIKDINLFFEKGINCKKGNQGEVLFIPSGAVFPEKIKEDKCHKTFSTENIPKDKLIRKNDILFNSGGVGTLGRVGFYNKDIWSGDAICDPFVFIIRNNDIKLYSKYLFYYFQTDQVKRNIVKYTVGSTGITSIRKKDILNFSINLPEVEQQKKIAQILDIDDNLRQKRKEQLALLDDYLKSVFLEMFGDPVLNSKKWLIKKLNEVGNLDRGISKNRPRNASELLGGPYPLIQTGDVANSDYYIKEFKNTYSKLGLLQSRMWPIGTLCITIAANIAKTGILTFEACFPDSVVGFKPNNLVRTEYVQWWMFFLQKILEEKAPESAQKNINLGILRSLDIPVPPVELQNKFLSIIEQVEKTKQKMRDSLSEMDNHFNALMQRYFE